MLMLVEPVTLLFFALALTATAVLSYVSFSRPSNHPNLKASVLLLWICTGACASLTAFGWSRCGDWQFQDEFRSPDGKTIARVEAQRNPFFDQYEISFRVSLVRVVDGAVIAVQESSDAIVLHGILERPGATFCWDPDSRGGVLSAAGKSVLTIH